MPQQFRKIFKTGKVRAHVARRADGLFLIRCQINKVRITATSRTLDVCKERFIEKLSLLSSQPIVIQERQTQQKHKRKGMKEKSRSVPISPMLKRVLPFIDIEAIKTASVAVLTNRIKDIFPNHHLHDLRHTFITRAQECGIRREIVSLWAGHKADSSITTTVYTHFQERSELQITEMQKYSYDYN